MTYRYFILLLLLVWGRTTLAQREYQPGYIVKPSGDTLRGLVRYVENHQQALSCCYRPDMKEPVVCYQPIELTGYGFNTGRIYESILFEGEPIFMQVLSSGNATLLKHNQQYYVQKGISAPLKLETRDTLIYRSGRPFLAHNRLFVGLLRDQLMADCPAVEPLLARASLQDSDLITIFEVYNSCRQATGQLSTIKVNSKLHITVGAGTIWNRSTLGVFSENFMPVTAELHPNQLVLPSPTLFLLFSTPRISQRFALQTGLSYLRENFKFSSNRQITDDWGNEAAERRAISVSLASLRLPVMLRYTLRGNKINPYIAAGPSILIMLKSDSNYMVDREYNKVVNSYSFPFLITSPVTYGFTGALGLSIPIINRISGFCEGRYEHTFEGIARSDFFEPDRYPHALGMKSIKKVSYNSLQVSFGLIYR